MCYPVTVRMLVIRRAVTLSTNYSLTRVKRRFHYGNVPRIHPDKKSPDICVLPSITNITNIPKTEMSWPSKNVPPGGVFQPAKVNYSPETKEYLQNLIRESKMTTEQRNKINYSLRSGTPLPSLDSDRKKMRRREQVIIRPGSSKRRSHQAIMESGAYERDKFTPLHPRVDRDVVKKELQDVMANGRVVVTKPPKVEMKKDIEEEKPLNRFEELDHNDSPTLEKVKGNTIQRPCLHNRQRVKQEIQEREEWLKDMEELGEGEKHRWLINQQIQQRLREMELLKVKD